MGKGVGMRKIKTVRDLRGEVYKMIREGITGLKLLAGAPLKELDLAQKLGVSRTPIREALNQLSKEGIVEIYPRKGAFVKRWTKEEVIEILILREVLEGLAARLATKKLEEESIQRLKGYFAGYKGNSIEYARLDEKFHGEVIQASGSARLIDLTNNLKDSLQMLNMRTVSFRFVRRIKESRTEHMKIIKAFEARDEALAEKLTREHFQRTRSYYESFFDREESREV
jgi:DNA-binding GntR family transcriptional regulator